MIETTCWGCGEQVSRAFVCVFAANEEIGVDGCPKCTQNNMILDGGVAGLSGQGRTDMAADGGERR